MPLFLNFAPCIFLIAFNRAISVLIQNMGLEYSTALDVQESFNQFKKTKIGLAHIGDYRYVLEQAFI